MKKVRSAATQERNDDFGSVFVQYIEREHADPESELYEAIVREAV